jgi:phenylpropionate dioxygenase-like ring-hydroxylating dioxygenase large terminal subunit
MNWSGRTRHDRSRYDRDMTTTTALSSELLNRLPPMLSDLVARLDLCRQQGSGEQGPGTARVPVSHYYDATRWQAEQDLLFGDLPIIAAHSDELPAGSTLAFDALNVPIVLTRERDGSARAFLNVCRHRGMTLVRAATPNLSKPATSLVCPYHGWTYALDGQLRARLHADAFEGLDPATLNLVELPCDEAAGLIFVKRRPGATFCATEYLAGLAPELDWMGLADLKLFRKVDYVRQANWKLTADAFLEVYHLRVLHRNTIYPFFADSVTANAWNGPHPTLLVGRRSMLDAFEVPTNVAELCRLSTPTQLIFPNTFLIWHPDYVSVIGMFSPAPEQVRWIHTMMIPAAKSGADWTPHWEKTFELIEKTVFQREDIAAAEAIQTGLKSDANTHLQMGKLEYPMRVFHEEIERRMTCDHS